MRRLFFALAACALAAANAQAGSPLKLRVHGSVAPTGPTVYVNNSTELQTAVAAAEPYTTVSMNAGSYSGLSLVNVQKTGVVITSTAGCASKVVLSPVRFEGVAGITVRCAEIVAPFAGTTRPLIAFNGSANDRLGCTDLTFDQVIIRGWQDVTNTTSSSTSHTIATGSKTFTLNDTGKPYAVGQTLAFASYSEAVAQRGRSMTGTVTAYDSGTGVVTVNVTSIQGSGTFDDWIVGVRFPGSLIQDCINFRLTNSEVKWNTSTALEAPKNTGFMVAQSELHHGTDDMIQVTRATGIRILGNTIHSMYPFTPADHPDAFQYQTNGQTFAGSDIVVSDNIIVRGTGAQTQGIFMGNESGIPYETVTFERNYVGGHSYQAITCYFCNNLTIRYNVVQGFTDTPESTSSWILWSTVNGGLITNNCAASYNPLGTNVGVTTGSNTITPAIAPTTAVPPPTPAGCPPP